MSRASKGAASPHATLLRGKDGQASMAEYKAAFEAFCLGREVNPELATKSINKCLKRYTELAKTAKRAGKEQMAEVPRIPLSQN